MRFKKQVKYSPNLAEIIGLMMGDGCLYLDKKINIIQMLHLIEKNVNI